MRLTRVTPSVWQSFCSDVESGTDITRSINRDTPSSKKIFLVPVSFQKLCHVIEVFLTSLRLVSRIDIMQSMTRDSSSNKIFLISFQQSCHVLEAFLASLRVLVLHFKSYFNHPHCSDAIEYDLSPICGSDLDVESRNDVSRSMTRDSSSNKMFLVSLQRSCHVLEAFLPSLWLPVRVVV